jgi:type VI secretion system secreted protein Hcp
MKTRTILVPLIVFALLGFTNTGSGAVELFLKIDGITGESGDGGHPGEIDVQSFSFGVSQHGAALAGLGTGSPSKSDFQSLTVYKKIDKSSPLLMLACGVGKLAVTGGAGSPTVTLSFRDMTRQNIPEFFQIVMSNVFISSFTEGNVMSDDGTPLEAVSFNFTRVEFRYTPNVQGAAVIKTGFDVKANKGS